MLVEVAVMTGSSSRSVRSMMRTFESRPSSPFYKASRGVVRLHKRTASGSAESEHEQQASSTTMMALTYLATSLHWQAEVHGVRSKVTKAMARLAARGG